MGTISFYISDYCANIEQCTIHKNFVRIRKSHHTDYDACITSDPVQLVDLLLNLRFFPRFRLKIANALVGTRVPSASLTIQLIPPVKEHLDYHW